MKDIKDFLNVVDKIETVIPVAAPKTTGLFSDLENVDVDSIASDWKAYDEDELGESIMRPGTKISVGDTQETGTISSYDNGRNYGGDPMPGNGRPSYVVDISGKKKIKVPAGSVKRKAAEDTHPYSSSTNPRLKAYYATHADDLERAQSSMVAARKEMKEKSAAVKSANKAHRAGEISQHAYDAIRSAYDDFIVKTWNPVTTNYNNYMELQKMNNDSLDKMLPPSLYGTFESRSRKDFTALNEAYPNSVLTRRENRYKIISEAVEPGTTPVVLGTGISKQAAWINAEERINSKIAKFADSIRAVKPLAVARGTESGWFWIKESPNGADLSFSRQTLLEAWQNAAQRLRVIVVESDVRPDGITVTNTDALTDVATRHTVKVTVWEGEPAHDCDWCGGMVESVGNVTEHGGIICRKCAEISLAAPKVKVTEACVNKFSVGRQPCQNFKAQRESNGYGSWNNVHECYGPWGDERAHEERCSGTVSFCDNCKSDHHSDGYDTCPQPRNHDSYGELREDIPKNIKAPTGTVTAEFDAINYLVHQFQDHQILSLTWRDFQKQYQSIATKYRNTFIKMQSEHARSVITMLDLREWLENYVKSNKYSPGLGKYHEAEHSFRDVEQLVLKINQGASAKKILKNDPILSRYLEAVGGSSQMSNHPVDVDTVGWLRLDFVNSEWLVVDEVQSDLVNSVTQAKALLRSKNYNDFLAGLPTDESRNFFKSKISKAQFNGGRQHFINAGYTEQQLDKINAQIIELFGDWTEHAISTVIQIARDYKIEKIALHTKDTIALRDPMVDSSKIHMYYDQIAKSFGFQSRTETIDGATGNFWVRAV